MSPTIQADRPAFDAVGKLPCEFLRSDDRYTMAGLREFFTQLPDMFFQSACTGAGNHLSDVQRP